MTEPEINKTDLPLVEPKKEENSPLKKVKHTSSNYKNSNNDYTIVKNKNRLARFSRFRVEKDSVNENVGVKVNDFKPSEGSVKKRNWDKNYDETFAQELRELKRNIGKIDSKKVHLLPICGYGVLNCNMTALLYDKKIIIIDAGSYTDLPSNCTLLSEEYLSKQVRKSANLSPIIQLLLEQKYTLESVIITHVHADHIGGILELGDVLKNQCGVDLKSVPLYIHEFAYEYGKKDIHFKNVIFLEDQKTCEINPSIKLYSYLLNHSSLNSVALYFNIKDTKILFIPDHRWDYYPFDKPEGNRFYVNHEKIMQIQKKINEDKPNCVVIEGTRGFKPEFKLNLPEESVCVALKNYLCYLSRIKDTILVSTYATNPIRLKAIFQAAKRCNREVAVLGGSVINAVETMFRIGLLEPEYRTIFKKITKDLKEVNRNKKGYFILCTGHMGQPNSGLKKLLKNTIYYNWSLNDAVILSSTTIPKEVCVYNRLQLQVSLKARRVLVLDGDHIPELHTSGHLANQDYVELIKAFSNTKYYLVNHGDSHNVDSLSQAFRISKVDESKILKPKNFEIQAI